MKISLSFFITLLLSAYAFAQSDTWSNVPKATDDRYTNPKSAVYAGPNGWWNFGEVRAEGSTNATVKYAFKGGLNVIGNEFVLVESGKLQLFHMNFGTTEPAPGVYQVSKEANTSGKKVAVSFSDVSGNKIRNWSDGSGTVTISKVNGFLYFKCRNVLLQPDGPYNEGTSKQPLKIGIEGAIKP
jgi:hypothetical protein